jgi:outer membrane immunogenic protein
MKKLLVACLAAAAFCNAPALAADMAVKAPAPPPLPPPACVWCGWYVGVNAGGGWNDPTANIFGVGPWSGGYYPDPFRPRDFDRSGFIGGGQAGYNYQISSVVFGLEADIDYSDINGSLSTSGPTGPYTLSMSQKLTWLSTVRGRVGLTATPQMLLYVTGGLAVGGVSATSNLDFVASTQYNSSVTSTRTGWTLGGGIEYALSGGWSAKAEYLYYDLGTVSATEPISPDPPYTTQTDFKVTGNIVRAGLNYKFGGPVAAN